MSAICFNITSSIYHHDWKAETNRFSSIHQEINNETPLPNLAERICSILIGGSLTMGGYLLPPPIGPWAGSTILLYHFFCCFHLESRGGVTRESLDWYRTTQVACLALNRYCRRRIQETTTGSPAYTQVPINDPEAHLYDITNSAQE